MDVDIVTIRDIAQELSDDEREALTWVARGEKVKYLVNDYVPRGYYSFPDLTRVSDGEYPTKRDREDKALRALAERWHLIDQYPLLTVYGGGWASDQFYRLNDLGAMVAMVLQDEAVQE